MVFTHHSLQESLHRRRSSITGEEVIAKYEIEPWAQLQGESYAEYELFKTFTRQGTRRSIPNVAKELGTDLKKVQKLAVDNEWDTRAIAFDQAQQQLIIDAEGIRLEDTLAYQHAIGTMLLDIGLKAVQAKNPRLIKIADAVKLLQTGADMSRKGAGYSDTVRVKVDGNSMAGVNRLIKELIDIDPEEVTEVEAVEDGS